MVLCYTLKNKTKYYKIKGFWKIKKEYNFAISISVENLNKLGCFIADEYIKTFFD